MKQKCFSYLCGESANRPRAMCEKVNLGYRDPATIDVESFANREEEGVLLVRKAGEMLYHLKNPPAWARG